MAAKDEESRIRADYFQLNFGTDGQIVVHLMIMNAIPAVSAFVDTLEGDAKTGAKIVLKALEEPLRQIAANAGLEGSVICENIKKANKVGYGFNALTEEYTDMIEAGIVDPTKVTRSALQNASSVAAMVLTTESLVADIKEPASSCCTCCS